MDWITANSTSIALVGIALITWSMLRMTVLRARKTAERNQEREATVQAAKAAERKQQLESVHPKSKGSPPKTRAPLGDILRTPFAGSTQGIAAKWEAEIHQIGRQIVGQIDCKMAALHAMTLDANRTANRLELLVEHLEQIARKQTEWQQRMGQNVPGDSAAIVPAIIPAGALGSEAVPLTDALTEFTENLQGFRNAIRQSTTFSEQPVPINILRLPESQHRIPTNENLRAEIEMLLNYGLDPQEIARRLNISVGEVDLVLQVQQGSLVRVSPNFS